MAFSHGSKAQYLIKGFNSTGFLSDVSQSGSIDTAETSTLGTTDKQYIAGLVDSSYSLSGNLDYNLTDDTQTFVYWCESLVGKIVPVIYMPQSGLQGATCYMANSVLSSHNVKTGVGDKATVDLEFQNTAVSGRGLRRGITLKALAAETTSTNTTAIDNTTPTTFGGQVILSISAASGTSPTLAAKVQHSTDNSTWVDLISFTSATGRGGEYKTVSGTVNRYVRALWTIGGTGSPSFTFHVAWKRNLA